MFDCLDQQKTIGKWRGVKNKCVINKMMKTNNNTSDAPKNRKMGYLRYVLMALIALLATVAGLYFGAKMRLSSPDALAVQKLFNTTLSDTQGNLVSFAQYRNKTLVINFWAPWCPPCVEEMPVLISLQKELAVKNIQFIGIGIDSAVNIANFSKKLPVNYPLLVGDADSLALAQGFGSSHGGLPFTVIINTDGSVLWHKSGKIDKQALADVLLKKAAYP